MANDRIFIVCDGCKEYRCIQKWYPGENISLEEDEVEAMNDFFSQHSDCTEHKIDLGTNVGFSFGSEGVVYQKEYTEHKFTRE